MKTMHITNSWSDTSGGIATFYRALAETANRRGQSMSLVVPGPVNAEKSLGDFVRIYEIASPQAKFNSVYRTIYPSQFLTSGGRLREILRTEKPDLIEINDKYTLIYLSPLLRLSLLRDFQFRPAMIGLSCERMDVNFQTYFPAGAFGRAFCAWYMRNIYFPFFDHHIAISDPTADELRKAGKGHEIARGVFKLPLGVDCHVFSPAHRSAAERSKVLQQVGAGESTVLLLYVGRMAPEKNLSLLTETMEALPSEERGYQLIIAGDGISRDSFLEHTKQRLGGRVTWLGHKSDREELARLYANCDFFLHPNPHEPFGIAPLEAMASGTPLIAPDSGGLREYANSSNAGLTDATGSAFASMVRSLLKDSDKRRSMIGSALLTAWEFSLESVTNRYLDLYQSLVAVVKKELPVDAANPVFVSPPPSRIRRAIMRFTAGSAASIYALFAGFRNPLNGSRVSKLFGWRARIDNSINP